LDKLEKGDGIRIFWSKRGFDYEVTDSYELEAGQVEILERGSVEKLTLYTCTPLFTQSRRLAVVAEPKR
jgi:LPXTG-site transpeptidase (sortase) family protein